MRPSFLGPVTFLGPIATSGVDRPFNKILESGSRLKGRKLLIQEYDGEKGSPSMASLV